MNTPSTPLCCMFSIAFTINANPTPLPLALSSTPTAAISPVFSFDGIRGRKANMSLMIAE